MNKCIRVIFLIILFSFQAHAQEKVHAMMRYLGIEVTPGRLSTLTTLQEKIESSSRPEEERIESYHTLMFQYAKLLGKDTVGLKSALQSWASRRTVKFNLPVFEEVTYGGTPLNTLSEVKKFGTGAIPVILIPEYRKDWSIFEDFIQQNLTAYTFYALTLPGYRGTAPYPLPPTYDFSNHIWLNSVVAGVISLIQSEKMNKPLLVGALAAGSYIATGVAAKIPGQVRGVVLLNGELRDGSDEKTFSRGQEERKHFVNGDFSNIMWYLFTRYKYSDTELDGLMKRKLAPSHPIFHYTLDTVMVKRVYRMHNAFPSLTERYDLEWQTADLTENIKSIKLPILVVQAVYDAAWPFEPKTNYRTAQWRKFVSENQLDNVRIVEVENARLLLTLDKPEVVGKLIVEFLSGRK